VNLDKVLRKLWELALFHKGLEDRLDDDQIIVTKEIDSLVNGIGLLIEDIIKELKQ
jgi:hypothetical protein